MYIYDISVNEFRNKKLVEKNQTNFMFRNFFKSCCLCGNKKEYGRSRQVIDDLIIRRMRCAWWISKATNPRSEYLILIAFPWQTLFRKCALVFRALPVLFLIVTVFNQTWNLYIWHFFLGSMCLIFQTEGSNNVPEITPSKSCFYLKFL
jgi:hypothetical protein